MHNFYKIIYVGHLIHT